MKLAQPAACIILAPAASTSISLATIAGAPQHSYSGKVQFIPYTFGSDGLARVIAAAASHIPFGAERT
jgi:hypothetical protein